MTQLIFNCETHVRFQIGKIWAKAKHGDIGTVVTCLRYYAGWADKVHGKTIEVGIIAYLASRYFLIICDRQMSINWRTRGMSLMALWYVHHSIFLLSCHSVFFF